MKKQEEWFKVWFNTPYYHILYKDRNYEEAEFFMKNLVSFLKLDTSNYILDLACGKGRHAVFLNQLGFKVMGVDLSEQSIKYAKQFESSTLQFKVQDMRNPFNEKFNAVFNLFTSFGFFEQDKEDIKILKNIKKALKPNGVAVIDFMNAEKVKNNLVSNETKTINNITFNLKRYISGKFIVKEISFFAENKKHTYYEKVKALNLNDINKYLQSVNFKIKHTFGDYQLNSFNQETSDRLILVVE